MTRTSITPAARIVVGVDGSPASLTAVEWAAHEAERLRRPLHLVHATDVTDSFGGSPGSSTIGPLEPAPPGGGPAGVLDAAGARARTVTGEVQLTCATVPGSAVTALVEASRTAYALVTGASGRGQIVGTGLGSVATQVVRHALSPVIVVKGATGTAGGAGPAPSGADGGRRPLVVVGVDGSAQAQRCLAFAFEQAASRGATLEVVHAWPFERSAGSAAAVDAISPHHEVRPAHELLMEDSLRGWDHKYPEVEVRLNIVRASAVAALLRQSEGADLLVVGNRGRGGFAGLVLGSVSHTVLLRAQCPVAVVRGRR